MVEWTAAPEHPAQPSGQSSWDLPRGPPGKIREYWVCLLLAVVTLGAYGLWYHWVMHRELCDYAGRPVREKPIWIAYCSLFIGMAVVMGLMWLLVGALAFFDLGASLPGLFGSLAGFMVIILFMLLAAITMFILFIVYVVKQYRVLSEVKPLVGLSPHSGLGRFLGFYLGAIAASLIIPFLGWVLQLVAYWFMHEEYTGVWEQVRALNDQQGFVQVGTADPGSSV